MPGRLSVRSFVGLKTFYIAVFKPISAPLFISTIFFVVINFLDLGHSLKYLR
jgi:hypothetical protein